MGNRHSLRRSKETGIHFITFEFLTGALWKKEMTKERRISFKSGEQFMKGFHAVCALANASSPPAGVRPLSSFVFELYRPTGEPGFDILLVHGLAPRDCKDAYWTTWSPDGKTIWPQTALSKWFPNARILSLSYEPDACPEMEPRRVLGRKRIYDSGEPENWMSDLGSKLARDAISHAGVGQRPLVIIAHSVGGLVVKQMIVSAWREECREREGCKAKGGNNWSDFLSNIRGVFYFATPHTGSLMADSACEIPRFNPSPILLIMRRTESAVRNSLNEDFSREQQRWGISEFCVMEGCETDFGGVSVTVGPMESASSDMKADKALQAPETDHFTVCKKVVKNSTAFVSLVSFIENDCKIGGGSSATDVSTNLTTCNKYGRRTRSR